MEFLRGAQGRREEIMNVRQDPAPRPSPRGAVPCSLGEVQGVTDELSKLLILTTWSGGLSARGARGSPDAGGRGAGTPGPRVPPAARGAARGGGAARCPGRRLRRRAPSGPGK